MKNIAEDTAVIKKIIVWTNERDDVVAHHHRHWLLSEPTAWKDLANDVAATFHANYCQSATCPAVASRKPGQAIRVETGCKNVYLGRLWPVRHPHSRL